MCGNAQGRSGDGGARQWKDRERHHEDYWHGDNNGTTNYTPMIYYEECRETNLDRHNDSWRITIMTNFNARHIFYVTLAITWQICDRLLYLLCAVIYLNRPIY